MRCVYIFVIVRAFMCDVVCASGVISPHNLGGQIAPYLEPTSPPYPPVVRNTISIAQLFPFHQVEVSACVHEYCYSRGNFHVQVSGKETIEHRLLVGVHTPSLPPLRPPLTKTSPRLASLLPR